MATSFSNAMPPSAFLKPRSPSPRSPLLTSRSAKPFQSSTRFASLLPAIVCKAISTKPQAEIEGLNIAEDVTQVLEFGLYGVTCALLLLNFQLICLIEFSAKFFMRTEWVEDLRLFHIDLRLTNRRSFIFLFCFVSVLSETIEKFRSCILLFIIFNQELVVLFFASLITLMCFSS